MLIKSSMLTFLVLFLSLSISVFSNFCFAQGEDPQQLLKMQARVMKVGQQNFLAILYQNEEGWHTYWKNPGDAGTAFTHQFFLNGQELKLSELEWPVPHRYREPGDIIGYGYEGKYGFFFELPANALNGQLEIKSNWLICKHRCIPGNRSVSGKIKDNFYIADRSPEFAMTDDEVLSVYQTIPQKAEGTGVTPGNLTWTLERKGDNQLIFAYQLKNIHPSKASMQKNLLLPFPSPYYSFKREHLFYQAGEEAIYGRMLIDWDGDYVDEDPRPLPRNGEFSPPLTWTFVFANPLTSKDEIIHLQISRFSNELTEKTAIYDALTPLNEETRLQLNAELLSESPTDAEEITLGTNNGNEEEGMHGKKLWYYLVLAFLGGLILNFMPCVLPVISLKLFGLVKHREDTWKTLVKHNLAYTLGILLSFLTLALVVLALKAQGEMIGWGFQLQSPTFLLVMILILWVFALNMFGLFELSTPGGNFLLNFSNKFKENSVAGDIFNGVLATVLSTPCSAPLLGTALSFAFLSSGTMIILIFLMIGLGLASPFLLTALVPASLRLLPRPGEWMNHLKKLLAMSLILTAVWLIDVFMAHDPSSTALLSLLAGLALLFFAFYFYFHIGKSKIWRLFFFLLPSLLFGHLFYQLATIRPSEATSIPSIDNSYQELSDHDKNELSWSAWSRENMLKLRDDNKLVFMDFTADWCLTCKVNEKTVLATEGFRALVKNYELVLLKGDWTKKDPAITRFLNENGIVGVPAYFIQSKDGRLIKLGEIITLEKIEEALKSL